MLGGKILELIQICQIAPHESYTSATPSNGEGRARNASDRAFIRECQQPLSCHIHWLLLQPLSYPTHQQLWLNKPLLLITLCFLISWTPYSRFFFISFAGFSCGSFCHITGAQVCSSCLHVSNICDRCSRITCAKCPHLLPWGARPPNSKMLRNHESFLLGLAHDLPASML